MKHFLRKHFREENAKRPTPTKPKLYHGGGYPGEKLQLDVKFVPSECNKTSEKLYQFTAIDEHSRWCYREIYDEHSTHSAFCFLQNLFKIAPFPIKRIQTDNGTEWTKALQVNNANDLSKFERALLDMKRFYKWNKFYSLDDARQKLRKYNAYTNSRIKECLDFKSPDRAVSDFLAVL